MNYGLIRKSGLLLSLLLVFSCIVTQVHSLEARLYLIANPSVEVDKIDKDQVRRIFTMYQTNWPDSQPIVVFVLASQHPTHQRFSRETLGLFPYQLDRIWNKLVYSGLGEGPIRVQNETEMMERIKQQSGAIGYVMASDIPADIKFITLAEEQ